MADNSASSTATPAPTATRMKFEAELFAQKVDAEPTGFYCLDFGAQFGRYLADALRRQGWRDATHEQLSKCKVATFEMVLKKEGKNNVHVTSSFLFGPFTLVEGHKES